MYNLCDFTFDNSLGFQPPHEVKSGGVFCQCEGISNDGGAVGISNVVALGRNAV